MKTVTLADPVRYPRMNTSELRETFLLSLYEAGKVNLNYVELDRAVVGFAAPLAAPIELPNDPDLRAEYFLERREIGVLNIGGTGSVVVDGKSYELNNLDVVYVGRGAKKVSFTSKDAAAPAVYYLLSYPAHAVYPTTVVRKEESTPMEVGSLETCNKRTICKYIHLQGARSSQLVMGVTHLAPGSNWNTMPAHTHVRRSEIYMYFNLPETARVFHLMGAPSEIRPLVMADKEIAVSPLWSIHSGVGTVAYSFCWGMGGENQDYGDMDPAPIDTLK
ncbi:5-dehydro-4-deoxy-D-glucuronate isomerase [Telmatobacter bradus]|uniref:5-dehydro-4-deoxy-D-glucuronate isomerase n=1 Tax=Telmatobacter bradus TaxID=474953 RepID=UPI003B42BE24